MKIRGPVCCALSPPPGLFRSSIRSDVIISNQRVRSEHESIDQPRTPSCLIVVLLIPCSCFLFFFLPSSSLLFISSLCSPFFLSSSPLLFVSSSSSCCPVLLSRLCLPFLVLPSLHLTSPALPPTRAVLCLAAVGLLQTPSRITWRLGGTQTRRWPSTRRRRRRKGSREHKKYKSVDLDLRVNRMEEKKENLARQKKTYRNKQRLLFFT